MQTHTYVGRDRDGIERVYGEGATPDIAETECSRAVIEYVRRRPETGPVSSWSVERK